MPGTDPREERVLVLAPTGRDARLIAGELERHGLAALVCEGLDRLCSEIDGGAGVAVVAEEALPLAGLTGLVEALGRQPAWSDLPLLVLTGKGTPSTGSIRRFEVLEPVANITQLERPVQTRTLLSTVRSALRARRRQYDVRGHLAEQELQSAALRDRESRLELAVDIAHMGVFEIDLVTDAVVVNGPGRDIYGWADARTTFARVQTHIHPADKEWVLEQVERAFDPDGPGTFEVEQRIVRTDGAVRWIRVRGRAFFTGSGADRRAVRCVGTYLDVTDRKAAEVRLQRSHDTFLNLIQNNPFGVYLVDADFRLARVSLGSRKVFAHVRPLLGRDFAEVLRAIWSEPAATEFIGRFRRTLATGEPYVSVDTTARRADVDDVESYDWRIERVPLPDGRHGVVCYFYDMTERRRIEEALKDADRRKDEFLALLAHELRNPLAPIRNGLQVIRLSPDWDARERSQAMMDRQLSHMVRLIDDLLDVSRISRNKMELRRTRLLLSDVVSSAVETVRPAVDSAGHELTVSLPDEPLHLDADLTRLAQVFGNLLSNSAKYTPPGGHIRLAAETDGDHVVVTVSDNGIGIPAESLPTIFDMFSQVDRSIERSTGGLGIGLALVKGLVEMHGGTVTAASEGQGRGATFSVRLPRLRPGTPAVTPDRNGAVSAGGSGRRVLVVDDNRDSAESMAEMLKLLGYGVAVAHDGVEAVEAAERVRPDVVLMDVGMPRMNGLDATRRIRERPWGRAAVIVALTGWGQENDRAKSKEAGCDGHLVKPVSLPDLQNLLGELA